MPVTWVDIHKIYKNGVTIRDVSVVDFHDEMITFWLNEILFEALDSQPRNGETWVGLTSKSEIVGVAHVLLEVVIDDTDDRSDFELATQLNKLGIHFYADVTTQEMALESLYDRLRDVGHDLVVIPTGRKSKKFKWLTHFADLYEFRPLRFLPLRARYLKFTP